MTKTSLLALALLALCSVQSAQAQEFISNSRSNAMAGFDSFTASLDVTGAVMSKLYDDRVNAFNHGYTNTAMGNMINNQIPAEFQHHRTTTSQVLANPGMNQSAYNQGNNQANNGFLPGGFPNGVGLPLSDSPILNQNNPLNYGINRNFINSSSSFPRF